MGYVSQKQLQADYWDIVRKSRERELLSHKRAKKVIEIPWIAVGLIAILLLWYLAAHYR
jgi:hypothetical protein